MRPSQFLVVLALLIMVPGSLLLWLRVSTEDSLAPIAENPEPVSVVPAGILDDLEQDVLVRIELSPVSRVPAPDWTGTVGEVNTTAGSVIQTGDAVAIIGGVARIAFHTERPFHRPLGPRDEGRDVSQLQELLQGIGFYNGPIDGNYGGATRSAVDSWARELGVESPEGRFDSSWVIWLPTETLTVGNVNLEVGFPAPSAGDVVLESAPAVESLVLSHPDGTLLSLDGLWELTIENLTVSIRDGEFGPSEEQSLIRQLFQRREEGAETTWLGGTGVIRLGVPDRVIELPASAVVAGIDDSFCVYIAQDSEYAPRAVGVSGGVSGMVTISSGLEGVEEVLINPEAILGEFATCRLN